MKTKTVYSFDPNTLAFLGTILLDEGDLSPLDLAEGREVWSLPGNTVEVAPPADVPAGKYAAAVNGAWEIRDVTVPVGVRATVAEANAAAHRVLQPAEAAAMLQATVQQHLDAVARSQRFDSIAEAATYFSSPVTKYMAQATALVKLRDTTWAIVEPIVDAVAAGTIPAPKLAELAPKLPVYDALGVEQTIAAVEAAAAGTKARDAAAVAPAVPEVAPVTQEAVDAANAQIAAAARKTTKKKA